MGNTDPTPANYTWLIDQTVPTVANVTSSATNGSYTTGATIDIQVVFSEVVTVSGTPRITLNTGSPGAVINYASGSGSDTLLFLYTVGAGHSSADLDYPSTSALTLNGGTIQDAAGNNATLTLPAPGAANSLSANKAIVIDTASPSVTMTSSAPNPTNSSPISVTVTFSESVSDFTAADIVPGNGTVANFSGSGTTYFFDLVPAGQGLVTADIAAGVAQDAAGNGNTVTFDAAVPVVTGIVRADSDPTNAASVRFTVTFAKPVTGVDASDFALDATGVTGASITGVTGSGNTRTVTVATGTGDGTLRLDLVDDDTIVDAATNPLGGVGAGNGSFTSGQEYTIDKTAPTAGSLVPSPVVRGGTTYTFTLVFSDNLAIDIASLGTGDIRVNGPGGFSLLATLVSVDVATNGSPRTAIYQITAPGGAWDSVDSGTYTIGLEANQVRDTAGNAAASTMLGTFAVNLSEYIYLPLITHPAQPDLVATISLTPDQRSFTAGEPVVVSVTITNQGNAPAAGFWVDLMINPASVPTAANLRWDMVCTLAPCYGIAWRVPDTLAPGASITLTSASAPQEFSHRPGLFAAGTTDLYVYVDSWNPGVAGGAVLESDETNNLVHLGGLTVAGPNPTSFSAPPQLLERPAR